MGNIEHPDGTGHAPAKTVRPMVLSALFAALMAACAWISVPILDIAFTMQTFALFLTLLVLGGKWGTVSILTYLLLGMVGLPVFSSFQGGPGVLFGVTGGYLWGFLLTGLCYRVLVRWHPVPALILGLLACYACGSLWFLHYSGGGLGLILARCVVPYLIPDGVKLWLAWSVWKQIKRYV